jgi:hypothetical protein
VKCSSHAREISVVPDPIFESPLAAATDMAGVASERPTRGP